MSHRLLNIEVPDKGAKRNIWKFKLPALEGKFGLSFFFLNKEVFFGFSVGEVIMERIVRKRLVRTPKAGVKVFHFDTN